MQSGIVRGVPERILEVWRGVSMGRVPMTARRSAWDTQCVHMGMAWLLHTALPGWIDGEVGQCQGQAFSPPSADARWTHDVTMALWEVQDQIMQATAACESRRKLDAAGRKMARQEAHKILRTCGIMAVYEVLLEALEAPRASPQTQKLTGAGWDMALHRIPAVAEAATIRVLVCSGPEHARAISHRVESAALHLVHEMMCMRRTPKNAVAPEDRRMGVASVD